MQYLKVWKVKTLRYVEFMCPHLAHDHNGFRDNGSPVTAKPSRLLHSLSLEAVGLTRRHRPISRYYSHLVAVRGRCSISHVHAGTLGFTYMEIHIVKYIFVWIERWIPILNKSLPHRIQVWSTIKFSYLFWTMSQWYLHFTSHSFVMFAQITRTQG